MFIIRFLIVLCVDEFRDDLSGMAGRVKMVGVLVHFLLGALLSSVSSENVLVVIEVVVIVFVKESFGHIGLVVVEKIQRDLSQ